MTYDEEWGDIVSLLLEEDFGLIKKKQRTNKTTGLCGCWTSSVKLLTELVVAGQGPLNFYRNLWSLVKVR